MRLVLRLLAVVLVLVMAGALSSAPPEDAKFTAPESRSLADLRAAALTVLQERENALREWNDRYQAAPLENRVALESEAAEMTADFERQYLQVLVEYYRQSGNEAELARSERMLEALDYPATAGTPLDLPRDLTSDAPVNPVQEGANDER